MNERGRYRGHGEAFEEAIQGVERQEMGCCEMRLRDLERWKLQVTIQHSFGAITFLVGRSRELGSIDGLCRPARWTHGFTLFSHRA